ncbi:hypothetical protein [Streptomyces sp. NRRL B-1347]|uniref:hypothetical protein n=1 Tax=Streptomyces sp. NRRL B-1347 TaxID=1476877 RepID=UPI0004C54814|nr:hypothetical protein [Streptomyces sp. NRRL B-1347]
MQELKKSRLRAGVLATMCLTALAALATPAAAKDPAPSLVPSLPLSNAPFTYCLTDEATTALREARIELDAVAPATVVTDERGNRCMRGTSDSATLNGDLPGVTASAKGGFAFQRADDKRAEFTDLNSTFRIGRMSTLTVTHLGQKVDFITYTAEGTRLSPTGVSTENAPLYLTPTGADALADAFGTSPLPAGEQLFQADAQIDVLRTGLDLLPVLDLPPGA